MHRQPGSRQHPASASKVRLSTRKPGSADRARKHIAHADPKSNRLPSPSRIVTKQVSLDASHLPCTQASCRSYSGGAVAKIKQQSMLCTHTTIQPPQHSQCTYDSLPIMVPVPRSTVTYCSLTVASELHTHCNRPATTKPRPPGHTPPSSPTRPPLTRPPLLPGWSGGGARGRRRRRGARGRHTPCAASQSGLGAARKKRVGAMGQEVRMEWFGGGPRRTYQRVCRRPRSTANCVL